MKPSNEITPTPHEQFGIVSMFNWFYRQKTIEERAEYYYFFYEFIEGSNIKKYKMLFLVLALVHGLLSQQRLNLDSKKWKTAVRWQKKRHRKAEYLSFVFIIITVWDIKTDAFVPIQFSKMRGTHFESATHQPYFKDRAKALRFLSELALSFFSINIVYKYHIIFIT